MDTERLASLTIEKNQLLKRIEHETAANDTLLHSISEVTRDLDHLKEKNKRIEEEYKNELRDHKELLQKLKN